MNRRSFLKVVASVAAIAAVPALAIPDGAELVADPKKYTGMKVIGGITRDINWHPDRASYFVNYSGTINNKDHYWGDFIYEEDMNNQGLVDQDKMAMEAFKRKGLLA